MPGEPALNRPGGHSCLRCFRFREEFDGDEGTGSNNEPSYVVDVGLIEHAQHKIARHARSVHVQCCGGENQRALQHRHQESGQGIDVMVATQFASQVRLAQAIAIFGLNLG